MGVTLPSFTNVTASGRALPGLTLWGGVTLLDAHVTKQTATPALQGDNAKDLARAVAAGDLTRNVQVRSTDETGVLMQALDVIYREHLFEVAQAVMHTAGQSFNMAYADKLFKPFVSSKPGGFGIGAYEARALAQSLGGHLHVDSRVGKGTRMTLLLAQIPSKIRSSLASAPV